MNLALAFVHGHCEAHVMLMLDGGPKNVSIMLRGVVLFADDGHAKTAGKENHAVPRVVHWPKPLAPVPSPRTELSEAR